MFDYLESQNLGNAQSVAARMDELMGFPNAGTKTDRYTLPVMHQADKDKPGAKRHLLVIKPVWAPGLQAIDELGNPAVDELGNPVLGRMATVADIEGELSPAERNKIRTRAELEAEGAFLV